jgi:sulfate adenylyltransferase subunit 1
MDLLKIATAGSVDDGKSTLIGRLLFDTKSITSDRLEAVETTSRKKGLDFTDLSLLTDGLIAEREQGITIDVAHIYFATPNRKYIIADTPGHVEYTRNMITGASNAEASIVLIDARKGVIEQTRRHLFISSLLNLGTVFICINKMDLVDYRQEVFDRIHAAVKELTGKIGLSSTLYFIPIAAKEGDNVVFRSIHMPWYEGNTLLEYLEALPVHKKEEQLPARFPVQLVIRPHSDEHHDYRGYAGRLLSGTLSENEEVVVLPSERKAKIKKIHHGEQQVRRAMAGDSVSIELNEDVDVSRGNMIVSAAQPYKPSSTLSATLCWMDEQPLSSGKTYLLQHGVHTVKTKVTGLRSLRNIETMEVITDASQFRLNDIGQVTLKTARPIFADLYKDNPLNGSFILIDEHSNNTVAVGFIEEGK